MTKYIVKRFVLVSSNYVPHFQSFNEAYEHMEEQSKAHPYDIYRIASFTTDPNDPPTPLIQYTTP